MNKKTVLISVVLGVAAFAAFNSCSNKSLSNATEEENSGEMVTIMTNDDAETLLGENETTDEMEVEETESTTDEVVSDGTENTPSESTESETDSADSSL
jgi:hypothetical protein